MVSVFRGTINKYLLPFPSVQGRIFQVLFEPEFKGLPYGAYDVLGHSTATLQYVARSLVDWIFSYIGNIVCGIRVPSRGK